jgi:hypothetical protein
MDDIDSRVKEMEEKIAKIQKCIDTLELEQQLEDIQTVIKKIRNDHPELALVEVRKACEAICKKVWQDSQFLEQGSGGKKNGLDQLINCIHSHNLASERIIRHLRAIQGYGNLGAHSHGSYDKITSKDVEATLSALSIVVEWYFENYSRPDTSSPKPDVKIVRPENPPKPRPGHFKKRAKEAVHNPLFQVGTSIVSVITAVVIGKKLGESKDKKRT